MNFVSLFSPPIHRQLVDYVAPFIHLQKLELFCCEMDNGHPEYEESFVLVPVLETFRFEDENDYDYEIWFKVFSHIVKKIDAPEFFIVHFSPEK